MDFQLFEIKLQDAIPNRELAAYATGRLLNKLNWHLQLACFWRREEQAASDVFDNLAAISYAFTDTQSSDIQQRVQRIRREWSDGINNESFADDCDASRDKAFRSYEGEPAEELRILISAWVLPRWRDVNSVLRSNMNEREQSLLELGKLVDQGVRCEDVYRWMSVPSSEDRPKLANDGEFPPSLAGHAADEPDKDCEDFYRWMSVPSDEDRPKLANNKPKLGVFPPDPSWRPRLEALCVKLGLALDGHAADESGNDSAVEAVNSIDKMIQVKLQLPKTEIPPEHRTRVVTKAQAARLHNGGSVANPTDYFHKLIKTGAITPRMGGGQRWQFDIRDFPQNAWDKLR